MWVQLLGPPGLRVEEREGRVPSRKALALVALLALDGPASREHVADLLWTGPKARSNLRQELYLIGRSDLAPALVVQGERLALAEGLRVDVLELLRAAGEDDLAGMDRLAQGELLEGFEPVPGGEFEAWLWAWRRKLDDLRREGHARQAARLEAAGDRRAALALHLAVLEADALQERHEREAIRLLSALGDRERALRRFERFRTRLADELGLEPLPETLQEAERARQGATPAQGDPAPTGMPSLQAPLIGRAAAWRALEAAGPGLTLLTGEPGVGKTRLAQAFAATFGVPVVVQGHELALDTPLYPVAEALRAALHEPRARARLEALDAVWRAEVARLLPELPAPAPGESEGRARFVEALGRALTAAAGPGGAVLWDDLHWLDGASLELLGHLARRADGPERLRLLATARADELADGGAAQGLLGALGRQGRATTLPLVGLAEAEVLGLVEALSGTAAHRFAHRLHAATGGNPLFVLETLRALFESGELRRDAAGWHSPVDDTTEDYAELTIAPGVREVIASRLARLDGPARRVLETASLCADEVSLGELAGALALSDWAAVEALEGLLAARLLEAHGSGYRFPHSLLRRTVADELGAERRRLLHRRLAGWLEAQGGPPAQIAAHLDGAGLVAEAAQWWVRAAQTARTVYAHREALAHYARALESGGDPEQRFEWHLARVDLLRIVDDHAALRTELDALDRLAGPLGGDERRAQVAIRRATVYDQRGQLHEALVAAQEAVEQLEVTSATRAQAWRCLGTAHQRLRDFTAARQCFERGLALQGVPPERQAMLLEGLAYCAMAEGDHDAARTHNAQARDLWRQAGDERGLAISLNTAARLAMLAGDLDGAAAHLRTALQQAREVGDVKLLKSFLTNLVHVLNNAGQLDEAVERLQEGLDLTRDGEDRYGEGRFEHRLGDLQLLRGRLGAALSALERARHLAEETGDAQHAVQVRLSEVRVWLAVGHLAPVAAALDVLDAGAAAERGSGSPGVLALERARLALAGNDLAQAERQLEAVQAFEAQLSPLFRQRVRQVCAELRLAYGEGMLVAELLRDRGTTPTQQAAALGLLLRAGQATAADQAQAASLLERGQVTALAALDLHRALAEHGPPAERAAHAVLADDLHARLRASLPDALRATFPARPGAPCLET